MKRIITIMACIGLLLTTTSWDLFKKDRIEPSKKIVVRTVNAKDFSSIAASMSVDVDYYSTTGSTKIEITAPENYQEFIKVQQKGKTLLIFMETDGHLIDNSKIAAIKVYGNHVNQFGVTTSADINIMSDINEPVINLSATSSGDIKASNLKCQTLNAEATSSADIDITTVTVGGTANIKATSSADIDIETITCGTANLNATSSADMAIQQLSATTVNADVNSSGDMKIIGKCDQVNLNASSSGTLNASGLSAANGVLSASTSGTIKSNVRNITSMKTSTSGSIHNK